MLLFKCGEVDKPIFYDIFCAQIEWFIQSFTHLFILIAWFYFPVLIMWCMWKTCFLCFKINYFNYLYFHSMPWLVCWVVSDLLRQEWLKGWKRKHTKIEGKHKTEFLKKLASTRSHGRRGRMPSANQQQCGTWLTRPRALSKTHMTWPHDWRNRVTRKAANDATAWPSRTRDRGHVTKIAENAPSDFWSPFRPNSMSRRHRPEVMKWGNASIHGEATLV